MSTTKPKDAARIVAMAADAKVKRLSHQLFLETCRFKYSYNFSWLGRPIIQYPQDIVATQEIIWRVKPDLVVETGIAHGGSLVFYASMMALLGGPRKVLGIDCEIRAPNRREIEDHPLSSYIEMLEGSSIAPEVVAAVHERAKSYERVLVVLDSNHTHEHVARELALYSDLVGHGSYIVVFDTVIEDMPAEFFPDRPWGPGDNAGTAVREFLQKNPRFEVDREIQDKLLLTVAPGGYLRCMRD
jgi:cephalosporin hydroxylase